MAQNTGKPKTLDAALLQVPHRHHWEQCTACKLPPQVRSDMERMIRSGEQAARVARALNRMGYPVRDHTLRRHMHGDCYGSRAK